GGPRCQEAMGDTTAQTKFESVSKNSNNSLLARGGEEVFVVEQEVVKDVNANVVEEEQEDPGKSTTTTATIPKQESQDKGKGIMIEEPVKPKKKDQIRLNEEAAKRLQAEFDDEEILAREKVQKEQEANLP
nr:hypothetical protein [Tanacetum cinerariifolium]